MTERTRTASPLRIALLVDSLTQPVWVRMALERAVREAGVRIVAVVVNQSQPSSGNATGGGRLSRWIANRGVLLYAAYRRLDRWRFPVEDSPFEPCDITDLVRDARRIDVTPRRTAFSDYFPDDVVATLRGLELDVAVRLGFRIVRGEALKIARHGLWSYHHGDHDTKRGGPPAFWEVVEGERTTGAMLQSLSEDLDGGHVLMRGWVRTDRRSVGRNAAQLYWMAEPFLARSLRRLAEGGGVALGLERVGAEALSTYSNRLYRNPRGFEAAAPLMKVALSTSPPVRSGTWDVLFRRVAKRDQSQHPPALAPFQFSALPLADGRDRRYPVAVRAGDRDWIVFSDSPRGRGTPSGIRAVCLDGSGKLGEIRTLLPDECGVTHPTHAMHGDRHVLIVQSTTRAVIEAWSADALEGPWAREGTMLEGGAWRRPTLLQRDGQWILFVARGGGPKGVWEELHAFFSDSPLGPWRPHLQNPLVVDIRNARPAGAPFVVSGRLFRPAEDVTDGEGNAVRFHEIVRLTETEFEERPSAELVPRWSPEIDRISTIGHVPGLTVIGVRRRER